jgi:hypothetical protein
MRVFMHTWLLAAPAHECFLLVCGCWILDLAWILLGCWLLFSSSKLTRSETHTQQQVPAAVCRKRSSRSLCVCRNSHAAAGPCACPCRTKCPMQTQEAQRRTNARAEHAWLRRAGAFGTPLSHFADRYRELHAWWRLVARDVSVECALSVSCVFASSAQGREGFYFCGAYAVPGMGLLEQVAPPKSCVVTHGQYFCSQFLAV